MFSWEEGRGVLPTQWLNNHPKECDALFAIRQAFYYRADGIWLAKVFRGRVSMVWLSRQHLCIMGKVQPAVRAAILQRFQQVEDAMGLSEATGV